MGFKTFVNKLAFNAKKHKPEIFFVGGLIGIGVGTVLCCKATLKTPDILEKHKKKREKIVKKASVDPTYKSGKDLFSLYLHTAGRLVWNYRWGALIEIAGFAAACKGFSEKNQQYLGAAAGLSAVSTAFNDYRERVREEEGETKDHHYLTGEKEMEVTDIPGEDEVDENGKKKKIVKKKITVGDPDTTGDGYGIYITKGNPLYDDDQEYFLYNMRRIQNDLNDKKNASLSNSICLNDIYSALYCEKKKKGMISGYIGNGHFVEFELKLVQLPDQYGVFHDAYWVGFRNLKKNIYDDMEV